MKDSQGEVLERMDGLIPWEALKERIRPFYTPAWSWSEILRVVGDASDTLRVLFYNPCLRGGRL